MQRLERQLRWRFRGIELWVGDETQHDTLACRTLAHTLQRLILRQIHAGADSLGIDDAMDIVQVWWLSNPLRLNLASLQASRQAVQDRFPLAVSMLVSRLAFQHIRAANLAFELLVQRLNLHRLRRHIHTLVETKSLTANQPEDRRTVTQIDTPRKTDRKQSQTESGVCSPRMGPVRRPLLDLDLFARARPAAAAQ